jgi:hypothetical protein
MDGVATAPWWENKPEEIETDSVAGVLSYLKAD